jgi:DNA-binding CsgD family transcriptional regulator
MIAFLSAADFVEAALRVDDREALTENMVKFEAFSRSSASPWVHALFARAMALLSGADEGMAYFAQALAFHAQSSRTFDEARTRLLFGEHLRRTAQRTEAQRHLRYAAETFEVLGATPWFDRASAELRASGVSTRPRKSRTSDDLTPHQSEIVHLVREGLTNRQIAAQLFLSPRTVDYHLRNVFVKLGITSRAELMHRSI